MPRLIGVDIPDKKRIEIALTYIFGVGLTTSKKILKQTNIDPDKRAKDLTSTEISQLQKVLDNMVVEGTLRKALRDDIDRLVRTGTYRGMRHKAGLPARGQRTRVNARTRRGKRSTVGAVSKADK